MAYWLLVADMYFIKLIKKREKIMSLERLVVLVEEDIKTKLSTYAKTHGHTLAYIVNKLIAEFLVQKKVSKKK